MTAAAATVTLDAVEAATDRGAAHLLSLADDAGWWKCELQTT